MSRRSRWEYFKAILARYGQDEFSDFVTFPSRVYFLAEASLDQLYFNLPRPNGRSSINSTPTSTFRSTCFQPSSSTIVSTPRGDTIYLAKIRVVP